MRKLFNLGNQDDHDDIPYQAPQVLSQAELAAWWPFTRLDIARFPKQAKRTAVDTHDMEDALV